MLGKYVESLKEQKKQICLCLDVISVINYINKILDDDISPSDFVTISRKSMLEFLKLLKPDEYISYISHGSNTFYNYYLNFGNNDVLKLVVSTSKNVPELNVGEKTSFSFREDYDSDEYIHSLDLEYDFNFSILFNGDFLINRKNKGVIVTTEDGIEITKPYESVTNDYLNLAGKRFSEAICEISVDKLLQRFKDMHPELMINVSDFSKSKEFQPTLK